MADTITASNEVTVELKYYDTNSESNKTIKVSIPEPKDNLTESQIKTAVSSALNTGAFLDPHGVQISDTQIFTAYTTKETIQSVDVGWTD